MKIPRELADLFQKIIDENKELGYRTISQYALHVLQDHAKIILDKKIETMQKEEIILEKGKYTKEDIKKIFDKMK